MLDIWLVFPGIFHVNFYILPRFGYLFLSSSPLLLTNSDQHVGINFFRNFGMNFEIEIHGQIKKISS